MITRTLSALALVAVLAGCNTDQSASESGGDLAAAPAALPAPSFTATTIDGNEVSLAALDGQVVIMDFWAVW